MSLRFSGAAQDLAAVPHAALLRAMSSSDGRWSRRSTTYYDTSDQDLRRMEIALALSEESGTHHQIVARTGEQKVPCDHMEAHALVAKDGFPASTGDPHVDADIDAARPLLAPEVRCLADSWRSVGSYQGAEIAVALDLGRAETWDAQGRRFDGPLSDATLELIDGSEAAFFEFAALFADTTRLSLEPLSQLDRVRRFASYGPGTSHAPGIAKAPRARAVGDEPIGVLLQRTLKLIVARLAEMRLVIVEARRPEGVHQMRVALRRLRSIERLLRKNTGGAMMPYSAHAKELADALGPARDWDVFCDETLRILSEEQANDPGGAQLRARADALRAAHWNHAVAAVSTPAFTKFLIGLTALSLRPPWEGAPAMRERTADIAQKALDRVLKKTLAVAKDLDAENLAARHPLRIALKKLRYPVQMFRDLYPSAERKPYMAALSALQDSFGALNDAVVAQQLAYEASAGAGEGSAQMAGFVAGFKAAQARRAAAEIDGAWARFEEMTPFWRK